MDTLYRHLAEQADPARLAADGEEWITAGTHYFSFDYSAPKTTVPTLLVRATATLDQWEPGPAKAGWPWEHTVVDVPGDHFSMLADDAAECASAVETWLRRHDQ